MDINFVDELYTIPSLQDLCHSTLCVNYNNFNDDDKKHLQYWMKRIMAPKLESNKAFPITCVGVERLNLNIKFVNYVHKCDLYTPRLNGHAFECLKYLLDNDIVDEIWNNFLENKYEQIEHGRKLYSNHGFSNNVKWRKLLLELEFSAEWFKMFFEIMSDLLNKEDWAPILNCSFKRGRNKYQLKIMMTRKWYNVLKQYDLIQKITTYYYGTYNDMLLMLSGDVETNPGPVMSKLNVCNNNPSTLMKAQLFGSEGIEKIANFLHDKLPGYMETLLTHTNNMDEKVKEDINLLNDKIGKNVDKLGLIKTELCRTLLLTCIIFALLKLKLSKSAFALSVISILNTWNLPQHLITYIKTVVFKKQIVENDDEVEVAMEAQIGIQDISSFGPLILTIISFFGIGKLPPKSFIEEMAKKTNSISRGIQGGISISENISKMWEIIQTYLYRIIGPESSMDLKTKEEEIQEWINDIKFYTDIANRNRTQIDIEQAKKVEGLYRKGIDFKQWCFSVKAETRLIQLVDKMAQHAKKLYEYIDQNNTYGGGARTRPLAITLFGESQIGKTTCVMPLIQDIMIEAGFTKPEEVVQQVYARQAETEFWDGYHGQFCIIYDDAFSTIDDPNNPNIDMQESIRVNNIFPHHLHCATLQDKNTFNTSELVIYTANDINTPVKSLSYPDAFYNRIMTHCYEVRPKDAYAINKDLGGGTYKTYLDKTKLKTLLDTTGQPLTQEIYEFVKHVRVFKDGKWTIVEDPNSTPLNFEDFSALMCSEWRKNKITYRDQTSYLHDRFEERLKRKMGVPSGVSIKDPNLMKSQVNSEDEIPGCSKADRTLDVQNIILTKTLEGQNLEEIESWFLCNDQLSSIYIDYKYKLLNQVGKVRDKFILIKEQIADIFIQWKSKLNDLTQKLLSSKFVILKSIIGMIGIGLTMFGFWNLWKSFSAPKQENENIKLDELKVIKKDFTMNDFNINLKHLSYLKDNHLLSDYQYNKLSAINMSMMINTENELELNAEAYSSPGSGKDKKNIRMRVEGYNSPGSGKDKKNHRMRVEHMMAEGVSDTSALEIGTGILRSNVYALAVNGSFYGNAIIVKGFNVLMPYHFITYMKMRKLNTNSVLSLSRLSSSMTKHKDIIEFKLSDIVNEDFTFKKNMTRLKNDCGEYVDGVVFCLSEFAKMHNHRNIIKHFLPKANLNKLHGKMLGFLVSYLPEGNSLIRQLKDVSNMVIDDLEKTIYVEGNETTDTVFYKQRCGYYYNSNTVDGDCGSPLLLKSNHETHKIIGMHVSGQPDTGYSVRITSEMLEQACAELVDSIGFRAECCLDIEDINLKTTQCDIPKGLFGEIGKAVIPLKSSSRSQITPSRIHGQITQPISKPAHLSPFVNNNGELIDPAWKGLEKCGVNTMLIDPTPIRFAETSVYNVINHKHFNSLDMKDYCRVFSYEEAIRGNDDEFIRSICRTTSPGYPFNSDPKYASSKPGKTKWMGQNEIFDFTSEDALFLHSLVTKLEHDCSLGIQSNVFCADTKKDERRPIAKVDEGKTRMFSACPMHYVVLFRQYYIGFASWVMHNRNWNEIAVGTNVYSQDWTIIAKKLQQKGDKVIAGDFSNFDGSLNISVLWAVFRIVNKWYMQHDKSEHNFKVRYMLWVHLVNSIHIHEDNIYQWTHSQPSGNPFTVILNSVYNCLIMRISYLQVVRDKFYGTPEFKKYYNMHMFCDNVSMIAYGDDNCLNISSKISDWFNQISISHAMEKLGHTYTDEGKTGEMLPFRSLNQIAFLKRKFKYDDSECRYLAPLDINVIYEMINWVRKNDVNQDDLLKTNIETALREMSLHSKLSYDKFILELENNDDVMNYIQPTIYEYEELRLMMSEFSPNDGFMA